MTETPTQPSNPNFGNVDRDTAAKVAPETEEREAREHDASRGDYLTREQVEQLLAERDQRHADELAQARAGFPQSQVPAHAGGPGVDNHQRSWSLVEQELSRNGETLDHWEV